jgi:hypothetical protein
MASGVSLGHIRETIFTCIYIREIFKKEKFLTRAATRTEKLKLIHGVSRGPESSLLKPWSLVGQEGP